MTTKFIGLKELRQNMATITNKARKDNHRLIVLRKNEPIFELRPLSKEDTILEKLTLSIEKGLDDLKHGRTVSRGKLKKRFGLD
jgi:hypothetical protein